MKIKRLQRPAFLRAVQPLNEFSKCCLASLEVDLLVCCVPGGHLDSGKRAIKSTEMLFLHLTEIGPFHPFLIKTDTAGPFFLFFRNAIDPFSPIYRGPLLYLLLLYTNPTLFSCQSPTCFLRVGQSCCENVKYWFIMGNSLWVARYA